MAAPSPAQPGILARILSADVLTGLMFIAFAVLGMALSYDLDPGSAMAMGPGYFPRLLCGLLLALGLAITVVGLCKRTCPALARWSFRPIALVSLSALCFAALLQRGGIVLAIGVTVLIGSLAGERPRPLELTKLTIALILATIALFVWAIGIPLPIWPNWRPG